MNEKPSPFQGCILAAKRRRKRKSHRDRPHEGRGWPNCRANLTDTRPADTGPLPDDTTAGANEEHTRPFQDTILTTKERKVHKERRLAFLSWRMVGLWAANWKKTALVPDYLEMIIITPAAKCRNLN